MQVKILMARFPFGASEHPATTDWLVETVLKAKADPRISAVHRLRVDDTPITMSRNRVLRAAQAIKADYVLMLDSDMHPDLPGPGARPFWDDALDFALRHPGPCVVASPYCGPPPHENVYVFQWGQRQSDNPNGGDLHVDQFTREEAARRGGFEQVAALPTGLFLLDVRALERLKPPYFYYEWTDDTQSEKASTEDVTFTRDLSLAGVPCYAAWDSWSGHYKRKLVGKPQLLSVESVREQFREALLRNHHEGERLIMVGEGEEEPVKPMPRAKKKGAG